MTEKRKNWMRLKIEHSSPRCYSAIVEALGKDWAVLKPDDDTASYWNIIKVQWDRLVKEMRTKGKSRSYLEEDQLKGSRRVKTQVEEFFPFFQEKAIAIVYYEWQHTDIDWMSWEIVNVHFAVSGQTLKMMDEASDWGAFDKK